MPRPAAITPNKSLHTTLNADLAAKLDLLLYSEVEQRVPKGAYQEFLQARIQEYFSTRRIYLATLIPGMPGEHIISGTPAALAVLCDFILKTKEPHHA